jgi:two-component system cell cycle sensor histidine kinase/response regulator CckA
VLLVEDEDVVRGAARRILRSSGYRVLEAFDPAEALRIAGRHRGQIDLVVTDVVMPNGGGPKLVEKLGQLRPDLKVLYMSGYTDQEDVARGVSADDAGFLQKPFTSDALALKVREILDAPAASKPAAAA